MVVRPGRWDAPREQWTSPFEWTDGRCPVSHHSAAICRIARPGWCIVIPREPGGSTTATNVNSTAVPRLPSCVVPSVCPFHERTASAISLSLSALSNRIQKLPAMARVSVVVIRPHIGVGHGFGLLRRLELKQCDKDVGYPGEITSLSLQPPLRPARRIKIIRKRCVEMLKCFTVCPRATSRQRVRRVQFIEWSAYLEAPFTDRHPQYIGNESKKNAASHFGRGLRVRGKTARREVLFRPATPRLRPGRQRGTPKSSECKAADYPRRGCMDSGTGNFCLRHGGHTSSRIPLVVAFHPQAVICVHPDSHTPPVVLMHWT